MRRLALLLAAAVAGLLALPAAAPAGAPLLVGIADQKPDMFDDPRFTEELGIRRARIAIGWDWREVPWEERRIEEWMRDAFEAGVEPLVSFQHSRRDRRSLPTPEELVESFQAFRERWPWVKDFAAWNEANHCGEPVCHREELVAAYWRKLSKACEDCNVLAAELLDVRGMRAWIRAFRRHTREHYRGRFREARLWGLHNYVDLNRFRTIGTRRVLAHTRGRVWLTETGGLVDRQNKSRLPLPESPSHAAKALEWLFERITPLSSRIQRVYLYHWNVDDLDTTWDSAFVTPGGNERPAYEVLRRIVSLPPDQRR